MKLQSSQKDRSHPHNPDTDWQILGELALPLDVFARSMLGAWLLEVLAPLNLHVDFLNKILMSAEDIAARAAQTDAGIQRQRTRLLVLIPASRRLSVKTWGFFCIEKVELVAENKKFSNRIIEIYLFPEGY